METLTEENYNDLNSADEFIEDLKSRLPVTNVIEAKLRRAFIEYKSGEEKELAKETLFELIAEIKKQVEEDNPAS